MRRYLLFCALGALLGCRTVSEPSGTAIALFCSTSEQSKTDILTQGDEIAVFARIEGTASYFLEAVKFTVKADGHSLMTAPAVAYPETNQAIHFFAYFPYHKGTFSVPTDQSTAKALKQADLCGAVASTTPVAAPVALEFKHLMARLVITTNKPTTKISFPNAVASGVLHAATAELVLADTRSDIWTESTTGKELIVPVQPLSRLVLTASGIEYVFDTAPIELDAGKTTTLDLTLHPDTKTATLSGSSVTDWERASEEGNPTHAVFNVLTIHWAPNAHNRSAEVDQVVLTINKVDYTVSNGVSYDNDTFTVSFASTALHYPYTISKISFYKETELLQSCTDLLGAMVYKSGASTIGIKDVPINWVRIGNLRWATGNLVASKSVAGARGLGGCRIGAPMDGGLYFQFGSLIGWKGGSDISGGTGVGMLRASLNNGAYWNGVGYSWESDAMVWPVGMVGTPSIWPYGQTTNQWYFGLQIGWSTYGQNIRDYPGLVAGSLANVGVGDPCTYYLGSTWRKPTATEIKNLLNNYQGDFTGVEVLWTDINGNWDTGAVKGGYFSGSQLFIPASGHRNVPAGSFYGSTVFGYTSISSTAGSPTYCLYFGFGTTYVYPSHGSRSNALPVRCVSN